MILDTALELFRKEGYEATTMRMIAEAAGVSVGNAYYYVPSKEHLVQSFYERLSAEAVAASEAVLSTETALEKRLAGVLHAKLDVVAPYQRISVVLARAAMDPESPLSPFSVASRKVRTENIALAARIVEGSRERIEKDLRAQLPEMLWLVGQGIALFWVYDRSPAFERTRRMVDDLSDLIARLSKMAGLPLLGAARKLVLRMTKHALQGGPRPTADPQNGETP